MATTPLLQRLAAANSDGRRPDEDTGFARGVLSLLEQVEYRRCDQGEDMEDVYRLRYKSYLRSGMVGPNSHAMIHDAMDDQPNAMRFGIFVDGRMVSTLRLHHVSAQHTRSPSTTVYGDVLMPRIEAGETYVDPSRFAADPDWTQQFKALPYVTLRLAVMACVHFDPDYCLSTVMPPHAAFYIRVFESTLAGSLRSYPALNNQVVLYQSDYPRVIPGLLRRYPFFRSTAMEQRLMFGETAVGESAPLTVLPTAKYTMHAA